MDKQNIDERAVRVANYHFTQCKCPRGYGGGCDWCNMHYEALTAFEKIEASGKEQNVRKMVECIFDYFPEWNDVQLDQLEENERETAIDDLTVYLYGHWLCELIEPIHEINHPIPERTRAAIDRYVEHGIPTGDFLRMFLSQDLAAIALANPENQAALMSIWIYCYNEIPGACWGSKEAVKNWVEKKRKLKELGERVAPDSRGKEE